MRSFLSNTYIWMTNDKPCRQEWPLERMGYDEIGLRGQTIDLITGLFYCDYS